VLGIVAHRERSMAWAGAAGSAVLNVIAACRQAGALLAVGLSDSGNRDRHRLTADASTGVWRDLGHLITSVRIRRWRSRRSLHHLITLALFGERVVVDWSMPLAPRR
jgi:hypothetical protein